VKKKSTRYWSVFDLPEQETKLAELEKQSESPDLWNNPKSAQKLMKKISNLRNELEDWKNLDSRVKDTLELTELKDESMQADLKQEIDEIEILVSQKELTTLLSGKFDSGNALLTINAGAGGTDSQDWTAMLQRMYLRWAEKHKYSVQILDIN